MFKTKITALLVIAVSLGASIIAQAASPVLPGEKPPYRLGVTYDGQNIETTQYLGKVLVVTFWASWCGPCKKELPLLEGLQRAAGKDRLQVVAVNIEDRDQFRRVSRALASASLMVTHDYNKGSADAYGVRGIPHLVLIGKDGKVIKVHRGYSEEGVDAILAEVNAALADGAQKAASTVSLNY
ncbi:MAG: TlpA family protein disulfide reductase [Betaproteobacteria bacterium]|nr:TlpA family protein disulfide reductase [Betaproteobacteria bacterium]